MQVMPNVGIRPNVGRRPNVGIRPNGGFRGANTGKPNMDASYLAVAPIISTNPYGHTP